MLAYSKNHEEIFTVLYLGPVSVDQFGDGEDEAEVDVEQCSDSEALSRSRTPRFTSRATPPSDEERLTPEPVSIEKFAFRSHFVMFFL